MSDRIAVLGAGVIGQVYAAQLHSAGEDVTLLARGKRLGALQKCGVRLTSPDIRFADQVIRVPVADVAEPPAVDSVVVAVRAQDLASALGTVAAMGDPTVVLLMNPAASIDLIDEQLDPSRVVLAFPGIGGALRDDGSIEWLPVRQQPTTVDESAPQCQQTIELLARTGLAVTAEPKMRDWLATHSVFVSCLCAGVLRADGDAAVLAADRGLLSQMVGATRSGFRTYRRLGGVIRPRALGVLFGPLPAFVAVSYWRRALRSDMGRLTVAPHALASEHDEVPVVCQHALQLTQHRSEPLNRWLSLIANGNSQSGDETLQR